MNELKEDKFPCELRNSLRFREHARERWAPGKNLNRTVVNDLPAKQVSVEIIDQKDASSYVCPHGGGTLLLMTQEIDKRLNLSDHSWCVCCCFVVVSDSCDPMDCSPTRLLCPWDFPDKNTGVGCHFLLQGIFLTQGSNPHLLLGRQILYR